MRVAYTVRGQGAPALVFVHGWLCDQTYWDGQVEAFSADHTVVTLDLGGHGRSGTDRPRWNMDLLGDDVRAVVEGLDIHDVVLVGHAMGARACLLAAADMPGRVRLVVPVDTMQNVEMEWDDGFWDETRREFERDFDVTCEQIAYSMFSSFADPDLVAHVAQDMCATPRDVAMNLFDAMRSYDPRAALEACPVPVRAIQGEFIPTNVAVNRRHGDFDAATVEDTGHFPHLERPDAFNDALRTWLQALRRPCD